MDAGFGAIQAARRKSGGGRERKPAFQLSFDSALKVDFRGSRVASDGGLILVRELEERRAAGNSFHGISLTPAGKIASYL